MLKVLSTILLVVAFKSEALMGQSVQAGISAVGNVLTVSAKPSANLAGNYSSGNISIRWLTAQNVTLGTTTNVNGTWAVDVENQVSDIYTYTTFTFIASSTIPINWTAENTYVLFSVPVNQTGFGAGDFELTPTDFTAATGWYFEVGGGDLTDYLVNYYANMVTGVALPVELTSFTAASNGRNVDLAWKTATEINSNKFEIERKNGNEWTKISAIDASGNSNAPKEYSYVDKIKSAVSGNVAYRLKMVDNDGKFEYSSVAEVKIVPTVYSLEQNYPNPFNPETKIQYSLPMDAKVTLKVYDMVGREVATVVSEQQTAGFYEQKFGGYNYSSGVYFYRIVAESGGKISFTSIKKMVMIK